MRRLPEYREHELRDLRRDRNILRMAIYEMLWPMTYPIVGNEAIDIAKNLER
jgi:transcription termination factor NusB